MELGILVVLIIIVLFMYKDIKWISYLLGIIEIFLRLIHFIGDKLEITAINNIINQYLPSSIFSILGKYSTKIIYEILSWVLVGFLILFLYHLIKYFIRKK